MANKTVHVVFPGRDSRTLKELRIYLGYARELGRPVTTSQAVRHLHRHYRRASGGSGDGRGRR
jgi:hypothetical protein